MLSRICMKSKQSVCSDDCAPCIVKAALPANAHIKFVVLVMVPAHKPVCMCARFIPCARLALSDLPVLRLIDVIVIV